MDDNILDKILEVAVKGAYAAGAIIRNRRGTSLNLDEKSGHMDLVTEVDKGCQDAIEREITTNFPSHFILGEESVDAGADASKAAILANFEKEWLWIIDPLDGTTNFVYSLPFSTVSIGVAYKSEVVVGVIYQPYLDEMFTCMKGRGVYLNKSPTPCSVDKGPTVLKKALIAYGFHHRPEVQAVMMKSAPVVVRKCRGGRNLGSAALNLAYVAAGRFSAFYELDLASWDLAAGTLMVAEAGGRVTDVRGAPYTILTRDILVSNGHDAIHNEILATLAELGANVSP
jgi:myo-inositol-1(or 4)-monophosphatase